MPLPLFGTNTSFESLVANNQTIAQLGPDGQKHVWDGIASLLNAFNAQQKELVSQFCERTTGRLRKYGGGKRFRMQRTDEFGRGNAQKMLVGSYVGFPMEKYEIATQWTATARKNMKVSEIAAQVTAVVTASATGVIGNIKTALMGGVNYIFSDYLVDHVDNQFSLPVKALLNADGQVIPPGPNGETFNGSTHTHYLASVVLTNSWLVALVDTVVQHVNNGVPVMWINYADADAVSALPSFKELVYSTTQKSANQEYGEGVLDPVNINNRQIGWFRGAAVWVKPFWPANYFLCFIAATAQGKPLAFRVRGTDPNGGEEVPDAGDLVLIYEDEEHPLRATGWEQEYGIGVWGRNLAAIGYVGASTYVIPDTTTFF